MDSTANTWLAILAISTMVQTLVIIGVLVVLARVVQRLSQQVVRLQRDQIEPLVGRMNAIADDVQDGMVRLRSADDGIRRVVARGVDGTVDAVRTARNHIWPALGVVRGATAAVSFLARRLPADFAQFKDRRHSSAADRRPKGVRDARI